MKLDPLPKPMIPADPNPNFDRRYIENGVTRTVIAHLRLRTDDLLSMLEELPPGLVPFTDAENICRELGIKIDSKFVVWSAVSRYMEQVRLIQIKGG